MRNRIWIALMVCVAATATGCRPPSALSSGSQSGLASVEVDQNWTPDMARIQSAMDRFRALKAFPNYSSSDPLPGIPSADAPAIPKRVFGIISQNLFGQRPPIQIQSCPAFMAAKCDDFGGAMVDKARMTVFVSTDATKHPWIAQHSSAAFVITHEISHYVYESLVSLEGKSPSGQPSLLSKGTNLGKTPQEQAAAGGKAHAEVDAIALVIMRAAALPTTGIMDVLQQSEADMARQLVQIVKDNPQFKDMPNPESIRVRSMARLLSL